MTASRQKEGQWLVRRTGRITGHSLSFNRDDNQVFTQHVLTIRTEREKKVPWG